MFSNILGQILNSEKPTTSPMSVVKTDAIDGITGGPIFYGPQQASNRTLGYMQDQAALKIAEAQHEMLQKTEYQSRLAEHLNRVTAIFRQLAINSPSETAEDMKKLRKKSILLAENELKLCEEYKALKEGQEVLK